MRISLGVFTACLAAASLVSPAAFAQRTREAQAIVIGPSGSYFGIGAADVTPERAKALNLKEDRGVEVSTVDPEGPAAKAGVKEGDVVLEYNGQPVQSYAQFRRLVQETPVGRQVKVVVWRNGASQTIAATIGERKNGPMIVGPEGSSNWNFSMPEMPNIEMPRFGVMNQSTMLGITGENLGQEEQLAEFFGVTDGVLVRNVRKGSAAEKAGIKAGDVITKIDDTKITSSPEITRALRNARSKKTVTVTVVRNKKETPLTVTIESAGNAVRASLNLINC